MAPSEPWLIYALGGGWGHLNRAIALARPLAAQQRVQILTNSPYAGWVSQRLQHWSQQGQAMPELISFPATLDKATLCYQVRAHLFSGCYCCLIVDTFPRGLGGELADLLPLLTSYPKVLVHRDLNPDYVQSKDLWAFVAQHYDRVIIPGEGPDLPLASLPQACHTPPWLIYSCVELADRLQTLTTLSTLPRKAVQRRRVWQHCPVAEASSPAGLEEPAAQVTAAPLILVCTSGNLSEQALFGSLTAHLSQAFPTAVVRCLAHDCPPDCPAENWLQDWPGLPWIAQATVVVGSGGYNTVYECAALQTPLVAFALPRLYDRQARRLGRYGNQVSTVAAAVTAVEAQMAAASESLRQSHLNRPLGDARDLNYLNGAIAACQQIQALL